MPYNISYVTGQVKLVYYIVNLVMMHAKIGLDSLFLYNELQPCHSSAEGYGFYQIKQCLTYALTFPAMLSLLVLIPLLALSLMYLCHK